ncbi:hypothetical protein [Brucella ciceri]|uniref:hypothetical protein n=1 Tax=Brucella ciceri TaxID=391287 RepID=UPI0035BC3943
MFSGNRLSAISCGLISAIFLFSHSIAGASETGDLSSRDRADLLRYAGIDCGANGNGDCVAGNTERGDYYNVRVYGDCAKAAYFGRTNDKSTPLRKDVATTGTKGKTEGALAPNQLVCIRAAAQVGMHDTEYYSWHCRWTTVQNAKVESDAKSLRHCQPDTRRLWPSAARTVSKATLIARRDGFSQ